ncbi:MAG TPA: aminotransferase class V-fold PLP-dependent enzyme, partial [Pyrinomonadaceae bacterium]|nr:aminotransferase class V-fold PLP-dependent enzyme [Pyrinomonadaceae bacterium]
MKELLEDTARRALSYLESLETRSVAPPPAAVANLSTLEQSLPERATSPEQVIKTLDEVCSPATTAMAGPRFFGFVIGGVLPVTLAANWLAGAWDQNTGLFKPSPATSQLEQVALRWLLELFGFPPGCGGAFVTGATMANFSALAAARHHVLERAGWSVEADGLFGAPPITVIVGAEAHPTLFKSLGLLGLGRNRVVQVPVDSQGRMCARALPPISGPTIVCLQAGNVNTGAFDPLKEIGRQAHESGAWVHVDAAFGLWAAASPSTSHL